MKPHLRAFRAGSEVRWACYLPREQGLRYFPDQRSTYVGWGLTPTVAYVMWAANYGIYKL